MERGGVRLSRRLPPVERGHDDAALGQRLVNHLVAEPIAPAPGAAVQLDHHRKWPGALRPVEAREIWRACVTDVLDVLDLDLVAHGGLLTGFRTRADLCRPAALGGQSPSPRARSQASGLGAEQRGQARASRLATSAMSATPSSPPTASMRAVARGGPRTEAV